MPEGTSFGALLRSRREELGLTLREVAGQMGWSVSHQSKLERGSQLLHSRDQLAALADLLHMTVELLLRAHLADSRFINFDLEDARPSQRDLVHSLALNIDQLDDDAIDQVLSIIDPAGRPLPGVPLISLREG